MVLNSTLRRKTNMKTYQEQKLLAIIPARKNSKSIKNKNLYAVAGKPLIEYTYHAAASSQAISQTIVTTDDPEIIRLAAPYGFAVHKRPEYLATDSALMHDVVMDVLDSLQTTYHYCILLQPTSPLRTATHIQEAWEQFQKKQASSLISVKKIDSSYCKVFTQTEDQLLIKLFNTDYAFMPRQGLPPLFQPNGAIYIFDIKRFLKEKNFFINQCISYIMNSSVSIDIDNIEDIAKFEEILNVDR